MPASPTADPGSPGRESGPGPAAEPVQAPDPSTFNVLSDAQLGYLVANSGGALRGNASGPEGLIGNTGAALIGNTGAALIGNTGAALIGNSGAALAGNSGGALAGNSGGALAGNSGGAYRVSATLRGVADGLVYLADQDERLYVDARRRLLSALTDEDGAFAVTAPATEALVVNVLLKGDRRLSSVAGTLAVAAEGGQAARVQVDLATTLVTEYLRWKGAQHGFSFGAVLADPEAARSLAAATDLTRALLADEQILARIDPADLVLGNLPRLRQRYVTLFGTAADRRLSDEWTALLRRLAGDPTGPDVKYRPLAVTAVDAGVPAGNGIHAVAVGPEGTVYLSDSNAQTLALRRIAPGGERNVLLEKPRQGDDGMSRVSGLAVTAGGKLIVPEGARAWIALLDPASPSSAVAYLDYRNYAGWTNPRLLFDAYHQVDQGAIPDDVVLDDEPDPGLYFPDTGHHSVLHVPKTLTSAAGLFLDFTLLGFHGYPTAATDPVPGANWDVAKLNRPAAAAFHRRKRDGARFLYVADSGNQVLLELNLGTGGIRRIAGLVPPYNGPHARLPGCYQPAEEGGDPRQAHLRRPAKMAFDSQERLVFADRDNGLIRLIDVYAPYPRIWTVAGLALPDDDSCNATGGPPAFARGDGEARAVALGQPSYLAFDADGNLLVADPTSNRLRKVWTSFLR